MITVRQMERFWQGRQYDRMFCLAMEMRPEASGRLAVEMARAIPAAAMTIVRLDELAQAHHPFCGQLLRTILAAQEADGGWGDPLVTTLCLKALMASNGQGVAIARGLAYLANLQKSEGLWPRIPIRRLAADPFVSAFILYQLADDARFAQLVRLEEALTWFAANGSSLDPETARLWRTISGRHRVRMPEKAETVWS